MTIVMLEQQNLHLVVYNIHIVIGLLLVSTNDIDMKFEVLLDQQFSSQKGDITMNSVE
jgi:hypothetical protein